ncbi:MAG: hypothetical protein M3220_14295, partial [Chloroflexota bacterium]|nr:hypothetical protein [Chloroflexota bacterium]
MTYLPNAVKERLWPDVGSLTGLERAERVVDIVATLLGIPLSLLGLAWLVIVTDIALLRANWPVLFAIFLLVLLLERFQFTLYAEIKMGQLASFGSSLSAILIWSAALLFGPSVLWFALLAEITPLLRFWRDQDGVKQAWARARHLVTIVVEVTIVNLIALYLYQRWGGVFPMPGLTWAAVRPALYATVVRLFFSRLLYLPLLIYWGRAPELGLTRSWASLAVYLRYSLFWLSLPVLIDPFGILASGLYSEHGLVVYLFFGFGLLLVSVLANQLGKLAERSQQRSRELERLEQLGRAIISAPPDGSALVALLEEHIPLMFPNSRIEIRIFPDQTLLHTSENWPDVAEPVWEWVRELTDARFFLSGEVLPWEGRTEHRTLVVVPIIDVERSVPIGGIY